MTKRPTSEWVPIERLVPHPANPNRMSTEAFEKLTRNIDASGNVPIIIVRSLEISQAFPEEFKAGLLQIIDGEHRWRYAKEKGHREVEVRVWTNVSDERAKALLLTLNRLHGEDDRKKRSALIRDLVEIEGDAAALASILPETVAEIGKLTEATKAAVDDAKKRAKSLSRQEPLTIFCLPEQAEIIRRAIKVRTDKGVESECREGEALKEICADWLEGQ
jgi:ParB-like chromosome segregation protein Spo0J